MLYGYAVRVSYGCVHRFKGEDIGPQGRTNLAPIDSHPAWPLAGDPMGPLGPLRPLLAGTKVPRWARRNMRFAVFQVFSAKLAAAADFTYYFKIIAPTK